MMKLFLAPVVALLASLSMVAHASAVNLSIAPKVVARFSDAFSPLEFEASTTGPITAGPGIYQVDYNFTIDGLAANERGFANTLFDLDLSGGLQTSLGWNSMASGPGWEGDQPVVPTYMVNTDAGQSASDLQRIIASIAPRLNASDARSSLGQNSPSYLGSVFIQWDGLTYSAISTRDISFSIVDEFGKFAAVPGTAAGSVLEFGAPADDALRVMPELAYTPPPPPVMVTPVIEPPPVAPQQPVLPPVVIDEPGLAPTEPMPQPEVPGDAIPSPPIEIQPITIVGETELGIHPIENWPSSHMRPIDWDGQIRLLPFISIDIANFDSGNYWIEGVSHTPNFDDFDSLATGAVLYYTTDSFTNGTASVASFGQAIGDPSPTPEPSLFALISLAIAGSCGPLRRR